VEGEKLDISVRLSRILIFVVVGCQLSKGGFNLGPNSQDV
jgi:hypothetical protein